MCVNKLGNKALSDFDSEKAELSAVIAPDFSVTCRNHSNAQETFIIISVKTVVLLTVFLNC